MKRQLKENIAGILESRVQILERSLKYFDAALHVTDTDFDQYLNNTYIDVSIAGKEMKTSEALRLSDITRYYKMRYEWGNTVDKTTLPEYNQLVDELDELRNTLAQVYIDRR